MPVVLQERIIRITSVSEMFLSDSQWRDFDFTNTRGLTLEAP